MPLLTDEQMERVSKMAAERLKEEFSGHEGPLTKIEKDKVGEIMFECMEAVVRADEIEDCTLKERK